MPEDGESEIRVAVGMAVGGIGMVVGDGVLIGTDVDDATADGAVGVGAAGGSEVAVADGECAGVVGEIPAWSVATPDEHANIKSGRTIESNTVKRFADILNLW